MLPIEVSCAVKINTTAEGIPACFKGALGIVTKYQQGEVTVDIYESTGFIPNGTGKSVCLPERYVIRVPHRVYLVGQFAAYTVDSCVNYIKTTCGLTDTVNVASRSSKHVVIHVKDAQGFLIRRWEIPIRVEK